MRNFLNRAKVFVQSEDGPTATEYAVMLALIIVVSIGAIGALGTTVKGTFDGIKGKMPVIV